MYYLTFLLVLISIKTVISLDKICRASVKKRFTEGIERRYYKQSLREKRKGVNIVLYNHNSVVDLHDFHNVEYYGETEVGGKTFEMIYDTGSSNLWVPAVSCKPKSSCRGHNLYDHTKSETYEEDGRLFRITYEQGPVSGYLSRDDIEIGDVVLTNYTFAEINDVSGFGRSYVGARYDGIVGLGRPSLAVYGITPPVVEMKKRNLIDDAIFGIHLQNNDRSEGEIIIGGIDYNYISGDIAWFPIVENNDWSVKVDELTYTGVIVDRDFLSIIDSGTSFLVGPIEVVRDLATYIGAVEQDAIPGIFAIFCAEKYRINPIEVVMKGKVFKILTDSYLIPVDDSGEICILGIMGFEEYFWIMGDVFMREMYVVYDYDNNRIGFADTNKEFVEAVA